MRNLDRALKAALAALFGLGLALLLVPVWQWGAATWYALTVRGYQLETWEGK